MAQEQITSISMPNTIIRRNGNHHPNLWSDDFIQSLNSPYGAPLYSERRETMIKEVGNIFITIGDKGENFSLFERLSFVDVVQRLGIDRYFHEKIKIALDFAYKCWNQNVTGDLNTTALGFLILRMNRYNVSTDVFQKFKNEDGHFFCFGLSKKHGELSSMLNLYRASQIDFPGEKILKEAKVFTSTYLQYSLEEYKELKGEKPHLLMEVEYALKYPWRCNIPRWEARNYIEIFRRHNQNGFLINGIFRMPNAYCQRLLELAILDFNILQSEHQMELKQVSKWWKHSSVNQLDFFRHRHVEFYFWWVSSLFEPDFATSRIGFTKLVTCLCLLDDIYDTYGTLDELTVFTTALIRWDISVTQNLPDYMKTSFQFAYQIHKEISNEAEKKHGAFIHKYIQDCWESYILSYLQEAKWIAFDCIPTLDQYLENGTKSAGMRVDEKARGEVVSTIQCYMKDKPGSTTEDALKYITSHVDSCLQELNWEYLKTSDMPNCCKNLYFNAGMRGIFFFFKDADGISFSHHEGMKGAIMKVLIEPVIP